MRLKTGYFHAPIEVRRFLGVVTPLFNELHIGHLLNCNKTKNVNTMHLLFILFPILMIVKASVAAQAVTTNAVVEIFSAYNYGQDSFGTLSLRQIVDTATNEPQYVEITGRLRSINPRNQNHGFYIHEFPADTQDECRNIGGHFNPFNTLHGSPNQDLTQRHMGDMGNIHSDGFGIASVFIRDHFIQVG